jgi:hypothetical protein
MSNALADTFTPAADKSGSTPQTGIHRILLRTGMMANLACREITCGQNAVSAAQ